MKLQDHPAVDGWIMQADMRQRDEDVLSRELLIVNRDRQFAIDPRETKPGFFWAYTVKIVAKMCFGGWWHEYYQCAAGIIWEVYREEGHLSRCVRPMDNKWHYEQYPMPTE